MGSLTVSKWRLGNGLEVILAPDPGATSISYMTWFKVGSRNENEPAGETGLAHLFEHLMFTQTKGATVAGELDQKLEEVGGNINAMTYYDFTAYIDNLPPGELALAARLEADRMVNLDLRDEQVANERDVVAEERLSAVEDSVDGALDEILWSQAFRAHPYRWPVIGWMKDIKAVTPAKAVAFYRTFYAPNNAVIVVAGKLDDQASALETIARYYGPLPASRTLPRDAARPDRAPATEVRASIVRPVPADRMVIGYPAPALGHRDRAAYDLLDEVLMGGPSSRLHRLLVIEKEIASSVSGDVAATRDPGLYALWVQMKKGHRAPQAEAFMDAEIARLVREPVTASELGAAKNRLETELWRSLESSSGKAEQLGQFEVSGGGFHRLLERAAEYATVTPADVQRVARDYLGPGARSIVVASAEKAP